MSRLRKLPFSNIQITGPSREKLARQWQGLTGHIGEVFPDLSDSSAWLGGTGEQWERGPYYLDGLIPLAYLLRDQEAINVANRWLDAILSSQDETGFFGPRSNRDWWPRAVVLKAMVSAYLATLDPRIPRFLTKYFQYMESQPTQRTVRVLGICQRVGRDGSDSIARNHRRRIRWRSFVFALESIRPRLAAFACPISLRRTDRKIPQPATIPFPSTIDFVVGQTRQEQEEAQRFSPKRKFFQTTKSISIKSILARMA
ncbi:MAG: hypothetical protein MZU97_21210 [Bacillus subtilis]|nr:hypothetical protein [Bacillus subtilis]